MNIHINRLQTAPLLDRQTSAFALDALEGLTQTPKNLSPKYFYDAAGSDLFEQITLLPEYYPTRTELEILRAAAGEIAKLIPRGAALVEFGAGSTTKVRLLLKSCSFAAYVPVDISGEFLSMQAKGCGRIFPSSPCIRSPPTSRRALSCPRKSATCRRWASSPAPPSATSSHRRLAFPAPCRRNSRGKGSLMILGVDLEKDEDLLHAAYNDAAGVTAKFNLNLLVRMNRELGANFDVSSFVHRAVYSREQRRIEMHLFSRKAQKVRLCGRTISFTASESIHTENSYKYSIPRLSALSPHPAGGSTRPGPTPRACSQCTRLRAQLKACCRREPVARACRWSCVRPNSRRLSACTCRLRSRETGCWPRGSSPTSPSYRNGRNAYRRPLVTFDTAWRSAQGKMTAPPGGALKPRRLYSGKLTSPPSNSAFRLMDTAKRRCAVPLVVLSRCGKKCPPSSAV